jgi:hypothetical protein
MTRLYVKNKSYYSTYHFLLLDTVLIYTFCRFYAAEVVIGLEYLHCLGIDVTS